MTQHVLTFIGSYHKVCLAGFDLAYTQGSIFSHHALGNIWAKSAHSHGPQQIDSLSTIQSTKKGLNLKPTKSQMFWKLN